MSFQKVFPRSLTLPWGIVWKEFSPILLRGYDFRIPPSSNSPCLLAAYLGEEGFRSYKNPSLVRDPSLRHRLRDLKSAMIRILDFSGGFPISKPFP